MNTLELLLKADKGQLKTPESKVEIKRLSQALGNKVEFTCKALPHDIYSEIQKNGMNMSAKGDVVDIDMSEIQVFAVLEGVVEPNLKSQELLKHYGVPTPKELVQTLLLAGEITMLFNEINNLSGFGKDVVEQVKN